MIFQRRNLWALIALGAVSEFSILAQTKVVAPSPKPSAVFKPAAGPQPVISPTLRPAPAPTLRPAPAPTGVGRSTGTTNPAPQTSPTPAVRSGQKTPTKSLRKALKAARPTPAATARSGGELFRQQSSEVVSVQAGLVSGRILGGGAEFFYPFGPAHIGLTTHFGQSSLRPDFDRQNDFSVEDGQVQLIDLNLVYMLGVWNNLLVMKTGIGYRRIASEFSLSGPSSSLNVVSDSNSICFQLAFGSYWEINEKWAVGADLVGICAPIASQSAATVSEASGGFVASVEQITSDAGTYGEQVAKAVSVQTALLGLRYSL